MRSPPTARQPRVSLLDKPMVPQSTVHMLYKQRATDNITVASHVSPGYRVVYYGLGTNILGAHTYNFHVQQLERQISSARKFINLEIFHGQTSSALQ